MKSPPFQLLNEEVEELEIQKVKKAYYLYSLNIVIFIFGRLEVPQSNIKWRGFQIDFSSTLPNIIYIILVLHTYCSRVYSLISKESSHIFRWIIYKTQHNCEDKDVVEGL